jgi:hypothetical protein
VNRERFRTIIAFAFQAIAITGLCMLAIFSAHPAARAIGAVSAALWSYVLGLFDPEGLNFGDGDDDDDPKEDAA